MPIVARCDECRSLFDLPEGQVAPEEVQQVQSAGIMRTTKVYLCPPCRRKATERGQPEKVSLPLPDELAPAAETEAAGPPTTTGPEGQPTHDEPPAGQEKSSE